MVGGGSGEQAGARPDRGQGFVRGLVLVSG